MFRIAVCDDEPIICTQIEKYLDAYVKEKRIEIEPFYAGENLFKDLERGNYYDLIFLDIELGGVKGVDIAKLVRNSLHDDKQQIIYISSKKEYAMELFSTQPLNFLLKPLDKNEIIKNVEKAMELSGIYDKYFEHKSGTEVLRIPYGDITYFESKNRKVVIHTKATDKEIYDKLDEIERNVENDFIRIHQSYLINRRFIISCKIDRITLTTGEQLPISKKYKKKMYEIMMQNEGTLL